MPYIFLHAQDVLSGVRESQDYEWKKVHGAIGRGSSRTGQTIYIYCLDVISKNAK